MQCPKCSSDNTQRLEVIYSHGTQHTSAVSTSVGVGYADAVGAGGASTRTTGTSQTLMAQKASPPSEVDYAYVVMAIIAGFAMLFISEGNMIYIGILLVLVGGLLYYIKANQNIEQRKRYLIWLDSWMCNKCGAIYHNQDESRSGEFEEIERSGKSVRGYAITALVISLGIGMGVKLPYMHQLGGAFLHNQPDTESFSQNDDIDIASQGTEPQPRIIHGNKPSPDDVMRELFGMPNQAGGIHLGDKLVSIWFEKLLEAGSETIYVAFIKQQGLDKNGEQINCHNCNVGVGAITYKKTAEGWRLVLKQKHFTELGSFGDVPDISHNEVKQLSVGNVSLLISGGYAAGGEVTNYQTIFSYFNGKWFNLGTIETSGENSNNCEVLPDECWSYNKEGGFHLVSGADPMFPDISVTYIGNYMDQAGKVSTIHRRVYSFDRSKMEYKSVLTD